MDDMLNDQAQLVKLGTALFDSKAKNVVVLDVRSSCDWADTFVIATYNSQGHLRGLMEELDKWSKANMDSSYGVPKKNQANDWVLVDWNETVIHLFSEKARQFYELEKVWFNASVLYSSNS